MVERVKYGVDGRKLPTEEKEEPKKILPGSNDPPIIPKNTQAEQAPNTGAASTEK